MNSPLGVNYFHEKRHLLKYQLNGEERPRKFADRRYMYQIEIDARKTGPVK